MLSARLDRRDLVADFDVGAITSDAGALLLGATDNAINLVERFAACFTDGRMAGRVVHNVRSLVSQRVFGIALGYKDLNDHDELRRDPVLGPVLGRREARRASCAPLAGKSTLNRLEHAPVDGHRYRKVAHLFVDLFLDTHAKAPARITLDLDATDDPIHGCQEGRFFHGYYDCHCYLPLYVFCREHLLAAKLRRSNPARELDARTIYKRVFCARGDMENRIKECQLDMFADRTSAATMKANQLRLWFASMAYVLLAALRRIALGHTQLEKATCRSLRVKPLKIGAQVTVTVRRIRVAMASACPYAEKFALAHARLCR